MSAGAIFINEWPGFLEAPMCSGSTLEYESRGRGFEPYSGHLHSHKFSRLNRFMRHSGVKVFSMLIKNFIPALK